MQKEAEIFAEEDRKRKILVDLKNQADNLLFSYESSLKDNSEFIGEQMKVLANEKVIQLQAVMANPKISLTEFQQCLDDFQQTLFAIGADVYNRANDPENSTEVEAVSNNLLVSELEQPLNDTAVSQLNFDFDEESTVQADYEAID